MPSSYTLSGLVPVPGGTIRAAVHVDYEYDTGATDCQVVTASWVDGDDLTEDELDAWAETIVEGMEQVGEMVTE